MNPRYELSASFGTENPTPNMAIPHGFPYGPQNPTYPSVVTQTVHLPIATVTVTVLPSITTQITLTTVRPPPVTVTSTYSTPIPTTSPSPTSLTSSQTPSSTLARSPAESSKAAEHLKKVELGSDEIIIIVVAVILSLLTIVGLAVGWYRGFYLPKKKQREEEERFKKGLKPLRLRPGPAPGTPRVVSLQPV